MNNVVVAVFSGTTSTRTRRLWKIDKGMLLQLVGLNLPAAYQVHFSNNPDSGQATVVVATSDMVEIPYKYLQTGDDIYAWVYLTPENGIGYTIYMVTIPVRVRPDILIEDPSEEQQNVVDSAIAALNSAVEQTAADVSAANEYAANAEAAQIGAEAAKTAAEAAQAESEINATSAAQNAAAAGQHASNANHYSDTAEFYAEQAAQSAQNAANKASVAETSADEALLSARAASEAYNAADEAKDISIQASNAAKDYLRDANAAATNSEIYADAASDKADQAAQSAVNASNNAIIAQTAKNEAEAAQSAAEAARDTAISNAQTTITNANAAGRNADAAAESAELAASYLDTAISALNSGVESVQAAVAGVQDSIDAALQEAKDSGEFDGADGYTPVKGVDYFDGDKGDTGATGETGNGIASAVLNADYTLTLTYTDGTTWTSGSIRGEKGDTGATGQAGSDGYSPAATVTQTETGATISITDAEGTTTANIRNGQDGAPGAPGSPGNDGVSPTISVTDITGGHRVTITDATGAHSFDVMDGESGAGAVQDVQVDGVSVLSDGVANVPVASNNELGVVKIKPQNGININSSKELTVNPANLAIIKAGTATTYPITTSHQHESAFYGLAKAAGSDEKDSALPVGQYTESAKSAISEMLNGSVSVSGTTPTINALPGIRYVCGEVTTIDIVTPASGIIDVVFTSGSTPAVLTVTPPSGMTVKWANGFDPTALEADTTYEINIADGCLGVAGTWT